MKIAYTAALIAGFASLVLADEVPRARSRIRDRSCWPPSNRSMARPTASSAAKLPTRSPSALLPPRRSIDVTTEKRYAQAGCARLNVRFWQDGVLLPGASSPRRQTMDFGINYCLDGQPPQSLK
jgi:hypothetical protein